MKKLFYLATFVFLFIPLENYAQKIKSFNLQCYYYRPPSESIQFAHSYYWEVKETINGVENLYKASGHNASPRPKWFSGYYQLGSFPGFKLKARPNTAYSNFDSLCFLNMNVGDFRLVKAEGQSNGKYTKPDGTKAANYNCKVTVFVPMTFQLDYYQKGKSTPLYTASMNDMNTDTYTFSFPQSIPNYSGNTVFTTPAAAVSAFNSYAQKNIVYRDLAIAEFIKECKLAVESKYCTTERRYKNFIYYIKEKSGAYDFMGQWVENMKQFEKLMYAQQKANNKNNWFTPETTQLVDPIHAECEKFITENESSAPLKVLVAAKLNSIWFRFLTNDFEGSLERLKEMQDLYHGFKDEKKQAVENKEKIDKDRLKEMNEIITNIGYSHLDEAEIMIRDFIPRYDVNRVRLGWD